MRMTSAGNLQLFENFLLQFDNKWRPSQRITRMNRTLILGRVNLFALGIPIKEAFIIQSSRSGVTFSSDGFSM